MSRIRNMISSENTWKLLALATFGNCATGFLIGFSKFGATVLVFLKYNVNLLTTKPIFRRKILRKRRIRLRQIFLTFKIDFRDILGVVRKAFG